MTQIKLPPTNPGRFSVSYLPAMHIGMTTVYKPSFKGIMCMADKAEMWLILLIPKL